MKLDINQNADGRALSQLILERNCVFGAIGDVRRLVRERNGAMIKEGL